MTKNKKINLPDLICRSERDYNQLLRDSFELYAHSTMASRGELDPYKYGRMFTNYMSANKLNMVQTMQNLNDIKQFNTKICGNESYTRH